MLRDLPNELRQSQLFMNNRGIFECLGNLDQIYKSFVGADLGDPRKPRSAH